MVVVSLEKPVLFDVTELASHHSYPPISAELEKPVLFDVTEPGPFFPFGMGLRFVGKAGFI